MHVCCDACTWVVMVDMFVNTHVYVFVCLTFRPWVIFPCASSFIIAFLCHGFSWLLFIAHQVGMIAVTVPAFLFLYVYRRATTFHYQQCDKLCECHKRKDIPLPSSGV